MRELFLYKARAKGASPQSIWEEPLIIHPTPMPEAQADPLAKWMLLHPLGGGGGMSLSSLFLYPGIEHL